MRYIILLVGILNTLNSFSQIKVKPEQKKCNEKQVARKGQRFADFECGKIDGVVDCNEKLELDEGNNIVFSSGTGEPFSGVCETCHNNGILERRVTFSGGKAATGR